MSATLSSELRFLRLERRVERIERQLGLNDVPVAEPPPAPAPAAPMPAAPMPATPRVVPPPLPVTPTEVALPPRIEPLRYAAHPEAKATADKRAQTRSPRQLEQTIGLKWAGWIGAVYGTSKAALNQVSRLLGGELLPLGVVVVACDPGLTRTEVAELHAAKSGFDISDAHPMEPVARALGLLATSGDLTSYAGRFMPFDQILELEGQRHTDGASQA
jgi:hypothetical protein